MFPGQNMIFRSDSRPYSS